MEFFFPGLDFLVSFALFPPHAHARAGGSRTGRTLVSRFAVIPGPVVVDNGESISKCKCQRWRGSSKALTDNGGGVLYVVLYVRWKLMGLRKDSTVWSERKGKEKS